MPNDAKIGLLLGVALVIAAAAFFGPASGKDPNGTMAQEQNIPSHIQEYTPPSPAALFPPARHQPASLPKP